jgi:hypothetical protein
MENPYLVALDPIVDLVGIARHRQFVNVGEIGELP